MSRSLLFSQLARTIRMAHYCQERNISTSVGIERIVSLAFSPEAPRHICNQIGVGMDRRSIKGVQYPFD